MNNLQELDTILSDNNPTVGTVCQWYFFFNKKAAEFGLGNEQFV